MKAVRFIPVLLVVSIVLAACAPAAAPVPEPTPVPAPQTIVDVAIADGRFTTLVAAVSAAGLVETLQGEGPFTVFAPTDDAFAALPEGTVEALLADIPTLTNILLYHVVPGNIPASEVVSSSTLETSAGIPLMVRVEMGNVYINDAMVVLTDVAASNGVIHVIDSVILPPADIVSTAVADGRFTTLVAAVEAAGLVETLQGEGPFTVFAPTDDAFAALPAGTVEALLGDIPALTDILLYHVVPGRLFAADVLAQESLVTLQGQSLAVRQDMGMAYVNESQIVLTDILTSNGVIHVIDAVLLPQNDIVETAIADGRFTTLVAALQAANLVETLQGEGPFTVFAPTDDAFAALPAGTVEALLADIPTLTNILLYHVVSGKLMAADVVALTSAETLLGQPVSIRVENGNVFINDSQVIITDIETSNGVIHVIDAVLLPQ